MQTKGKQRKVSDTFVTKCIEELTRTRQSKISSYIQGNAHFKECFTEVLQMLEMQPHRADEFSSLLECETGIYVHPLRLRLMLEEQDNGAEGS